MKRALTLIATTLLLAGCADLSATLAEEEANNTPATVKEGAAFTHDEFRADSGWKVTSKKYVGPSIKGLRVINQAKEARSALLTFRFYSGSEVLAEVECTSNQMQPREISKLTCFSLDDKLRKYDTIKVSDMW